MMQDLNNGGNRLSEREKEGGYMGTLCSSCSILPKNQNSSKNKVRYFYFLVNSKLMMQNVIESIYECHSTNKPFSNLTIIEYI